MTKFNTLTASILFAALSLTACGDDNDTVAQPNKPDTNTQQQRISGTIKDANGSPVVGAEVKIGKSAVTTDSSGAYSLSLDKLKSDAVILVRKTGYLTMAREFKVAPKRSHKLDITLTADQVTNAFATSAGISELQVSGAKISIPANSIIKADGSSYTGTVNIAANYYNPDSIAGAQSFAQPFAGQNSDGSQQTDLVTVGVIDVKLTDPATGAALNLKKGTQATLVYPKVSTDQNLPSIPLWYYDEEQTVWVKEGVATRQTDGSYKGQVSHFTLWNLDIPIGEYYALLEGCVIDAKTKKPYVKDDFAGQITGRGSFFSAGGADSEGKFSIKVPFNTPLTLSSHPYSVTFNAIQIPALAQNGTYQINNGNCIEVGTIDSDGEIDLNNSDVGGNFNELPLSPVSITLTPTSPEDSFQPPATSNSNGLIGYNFEFDLDNNDKLENVSLTTFNSLTTSVALYFESLYKTGNYQQSVNFLNATGPSFILTRQGTAIETAPYTIDNNRLKFEVLGTTVRGNQLIQQFNNGFRSILTFNDKSISGLKIGDVLSYNIDEEDFPNALVDNLNNLPFSRGTFTGAASCKAIRSINNNLDFITFDGLGSSSNFEDEVRVLDLNPIRGIWAGIPWAANRVADEDQEFEALVNFDNLVYEGYYTKGGFANLSTADTNECAYYNEAAKEQILTALREAYPTL
ncbi:MULTISPECIES: carboxypeptidase-like regulatory domain-containing protein [Psychrobacter]|jgi:hypothetical protein|nr:MULTISPECIES: carboxypeptidase-like regulatory domain-containing protein [Psychrobacter]